MGANRKFTERDADGVEYAVEEGLGIVEGIERPGEGKVAAHVRIAGEGLRRPVWSWVNTVDLEDLYLAVERALAEQYRIAYRIEVHRSDDAPRDVPFTQVDQYQRFRRLASLRRVAVAPNGELAPPHTPPPTSKDQGTENREPGSETPPSSSQEPESAPAAPDTHSGPPPPQDRPEGAQSAGNGGSSANGGGNGRRPRLAEAKPWEPYNSDGSLNLGSYAYGAVLATVELAHELHAAHLRATRPPGSDPAELVPDMGKVASLARLLIAVADDAQALLRPDGHVDRMDGSHTRARGAVRTALEVYPVPFGADSPTRGAWREKLLERAVEVMRVAEVLTGGAA